MEDDDPAGHRNTHAVISRLLPRGEKGPSLISPISPRVRIDPRFRTRLTRALRPTFWHAGVRARLR